GPGLPSICGLPVSVPVRGTLENLRGQADLRIGRLQDGAPGRPRPGRERPAQILVVGIRGRDHQALSFGELAANAWWSAARSLIHWPVSGLCCAAVRASSSRWAAVAGGGSAERSG